MGRWCAALAVVVLALAPGPGTTAQVRDRPPAVAATQIGIIAGRVELEVDGLRRPIRWARVTLTPDSGTTSSTATTDTDGRYRFERVAPGTYRVRAEKAGFVAMSDSPPAQVQIKAGDTAAVDVLMQRAGALEGQFLDDHGRPIPRLMVNADRVVGNSEPRTVTEKYTATTDDLGRFRLHTLRPGNYYVHARPLPPASGEEMYFPDATSSRRATVLAVASGQTVEHVDFVVVTAPLSEIAAYALAASAARETAAAPAPDINGARVTGRVTRIDTGEPIASASVLLSSDGGLASRATRSNAAGEFEFTSVAAGSYALTATAAGYVSLEGNLIRPEAGGGIPINVKDRERIEAANLRLVPPGAIEGRVLDEFGDPAPGVPVQLTQAMSVQGLSVFAPGLGDTTTGPTDDRGWFRMYGLPPGDYHLLAPSVPLGVMSRAAGSPTPDLGSLVIVGFATTFFPGTDSVEAAQPVHLDAAEDKRDVTFALVTARMVTISGIATDIAGKPAANARVTLIQTYGGTIRALTDGSTTADANGSFRFSSVAEGSYVLQGQGSAPALFGSLPVIAAPTVAKAPLAVALTLRPLITARGRLSFEGDTSPPRDPSAMRVYFQPTDFTHGPVGSNAILSHITPTWEFEIPNLAWQGLIRTMAPPGWWLKSVRLNGLDITDTPYDFQSADVNGLEVTLTSRVGSVIGTVRDAGQPSTDSAVIVFGVDDSALMYPSRFISVGRPDLQGAFSFPSLLPGRYFAVAVKRSALPRLDREGLATLRPFATSIDVSEGQATRVTLTVIKR